MYILRKALAYAIEAIDRLPRHRQESSDQQDMKELLAYLCEDDDVFMARHIAIARGHMTTPWENER